MIGSDTRATIGTTDQPRVRIRPFPTGRILDGTVFQAINCLARFITSLRDKTPVPHSLPLPRRCHPHLHLSDGLIDQLNRFPPMPALVQSRKSLDYRDPFEEPERRPACPPN